MSAPTPTDDVVRTDGVGVTIDGCTILDDVDWAVRPSETWMLLGPNGSGKTTLLRIVAFVRGPSRGEVRVLGATYGRVDVRAHRPRIGFVSAAALQALRGHLSATVAVMTAKYAALEPWWHEYDDADVGRARELLDFVGCGALADRAIGDCSQGERQRILVARGLMAGPELLVLDEPCAGLDLGGREALLAVIDALAADLAGPTLLMSTHHLEEIPRAATHVLLLRDGRVLASGPIGDVLSSTIVSRAFDVDVAVTSVDGRWASRARA